MLCRFMRFIVTEKVQTGVGRDNKEFMKVAEGYLK